MFSRFTSDAADDVIRSGLRMATASCSARTAKGVHDLYRKSATAGGSEELLLVDAQNEVASDWSRRRALLAL